MRVGEIAVRDARRNAEEHVGLESEFLVAADDRALAVRVIYDLSIDVGMEAAALAGIAARSHRDDLERSRNILSQMLTSLRIALEIL